MQVIKFKALDKITETTFVFDFDDIQEGRVEITNDYEVMQFVCKDKDNKDVFDNDSVWFYWMGKKIKAKVVKKDLFICLVSCEGKVRGLPRTLCTSDISHIEVISV